MLKRIVAIGAVIAIVLIGVVAVVAFRPPEEASGEIEAIPLDTGTQADSAPTPEPATPPTAEPTVEPAATEPEPTSATAAPTETPIPAEPTPTAAPTTVAASQPIVFEIAQDESEARFLIDEVLRGDPITVVGATNQVAGQIAIDPNDPTAAQVGVIQVNARTLETDNDFRNRAIKNVILQTNTYEFVTFTPTELIGLPETGAIGETYDFQIAGDLTIRDVTRQVTFTVTVTPVSEERIEGLASTTVLYRDFGLAIPDAPSVDTVADEVRLELEFVAVPVS